MADFKRSPDFIRAVDMPSFLYRARPAGLIAKTPHTH